MDNSINRNRINFNMKDPRFLVDSMLGNIAKKLRVLGFDAEFLLDINDDLLIKKSKTENKFLITRDKQLFQKSSRYDIRGLLLPNDDEYKNLFLIFRHCNIKSIDLVPNRRTRCTICNGTLMMLDRSLLSDFVPEKVYNNITIFFKCSECLKVYWNGTHIKSINILVDKINKSLDSIS